MKAHGLYYSVICSEVQPEFPKLPGKERIGGGKKGIVCRFRLSFDAYAVDAAELIGNKTVS